MILPESVYPPLGGTLGRGDWQAGMIMLKNTTNKPYTGITVGKLRDMRRKTRARYHLAVRQAKKNKNNISSSKMANAISNNCSSDLFSETCKIRSARGRGPMCEDTVVTNILNTKYNNLYNSVQYDEVEMNNIKDKIQRCIQQDNDKVYDINVVDVKKAVKHLKLGKSDGEEGLFSDNIIHAPHILHVCICMLFKAMLVHRTSPVSMVAGTMIPIPKVKHLICTSDNFRAITLSSVLCKLFDLIILDKEQEALCMSDLQFGFKAVVSSTQCTNVFKETVNHYNFNQSNDFVGIRQS